MPKPWPLWLIVLASPLYAICFIIGLPLLIVLGVTVSIWTRIASRVRNRNLHRRMTQAGRSATWSEVRRHLANRPGTIICDSQEVCWLNVHYWWISDEIGTVYFHDWEPDPRARLITTNVSRSGQVAVNAVLNELRAEFSRLKVIDTIPKSHAEIFAGDAHAAGLIH